MDMIIIAQLYSLYISMFLGNKHSIHQAQGQLNTFSVLDPMPYTCLLITSIRTYKYYYPVLLLAQIAVCLVHLVVCLYPSVETVIIQTLQ